MYGKCWLCGKVGAVERHHIFGGSNRDKSERDGLVVLLCGESCHRNGPRAAHRSAETALESILLVSKKPIEELEGGKVLLTSKSATSHRQLKIVLAQHYGLRQVSYETTTSLWTEEVLDKADAVLFIGDDALGAYLHQQEGYYYYDMGGQWRALTGGGMVYAVWVARREFAAAQPQAVAQVQQRLREAFTYGLEHLDEAAAWIRRDGFTPAEIVHYIGLLNYELTPTHQQALLGFYQRAHALGLIEKVPQLAFAGEAQA